MIKIFPGIELPKAAGQAPSANHFYKLDRTRQHCGMDDDESKIDHDTPEFAVESIYCWWRQVGRKTYPEAHELLITADGGGSNGSRTRLWKVALQRMADAMGLKISVCHLPPGTSKWNKIEHRMFCHITTSPAIGADAARKPRGRGQPDCEHDHLEGSACACGA